MSTDTPITNEQVERLDTPRVNVGTIGRPPSKLSTLAAMAAMIDAHDDTPRPDQEKVLVMGTSMGKSTDTATLRAILGMEQHRNTPYVIRASDQTSCEFFPEPRYMGPRIGPHGGPSKAKRMERKRARLARRITRRNRK